ncbi:hypothetical protein Tco_0532143 [Tanacetum coccineum]
MEQPQSSSAQQITPANELVPLDKHKMVTQVPNVNESIRFMVDKKDIIYTLDMFRAALKLPTATDAQLFILHTNFDYIKDFLKILGYQGQLQRVSAFFVKNLAQP